ncbi:a97f8ef6-a9b0-4f8b-8fdf-2c72f37eda9e [Achaetomium macrosporum]|uniref:A97f8ef6-a9b0-4f8b-8fdf-2c72f37eda9e n=1 Tax=Achaetomium macrosporum TaxID=79813 RepID=A0AAN7HCU1_9PEZI|nr:a97f8ef6-a9b0-4f8b-8fdf-2c72f37eda9e [Achaetomium macrosporum]
MEGTLCSFCAGLGPDICRALERLSSVNGPPRNKKDDIWLKSPMSPWHKTLAAVDASSSSCGLCKIIMKGWQWAREDGVEQALRDAMFDPQAPPPWLKDPINRIPAYRDSPRIALRIRRLPRVEDGRKNKYSYFLSVRCSPYARASSDVLEPVTTELRIAWAKPDPVINGNECDENHTSDAVHVEPADIGLHVDLLVHAHPLSPQSLNVARGWLETCVNSHGSACSPPLAAEGRLPTRLLEIVPDSGTIYLRETQALRPLEDARYVALSHCWGQGGTPFTTTRQTLALRLGGIQVSALPQTFRDAVTLVGRLGLRYLWIDSLCIIQDDADDWAREAARMADIYRNAHLVVNAANSDADSKAFLSPRNIPDTVRLAPTSPEGQRLCLQLLPPEGRRWTDPSGPDHLGGEPVSSRAWCLQERYLPVRALQYGSYQAFWECERMRASEDGDAVAQPGSHLKRLCDTGAITDSVFARLDRSPSGERVQRVNWADWYRMVEDYTARSITKHTDRLPALSGLAQAVTRETSAEYFAGLWESGLIEGLLWCRAQPKQVLTATPNYVAPSWSWASVVGPVQFPIYTWYTKRAYWKRDMSDFEHLADYLGYSTVNKDLGPRGEVEAGYLSLKAPMLPVASIRGRQDQDPVLHSLFGQAPSRSEVADIVVKMKTLGSRSIWVEGGLDNPAITIGTTKLSVVFLTRLPHVLEEGFIEHRFGLILQRLDGTEHYKRVGFIDGVVLTKSFLNEIRGRGEFSIVGFARPFEEGDIDKEDLRPNDLADDPFKIPAVELKIC